MLVPFVKDKLYEFGFFYIFNLFLVLVYTFNTKAFPDFTRKLGCILTG